MKTQLYSVKIYNKQGASYLEHKGETAFCLRTAKRYAKQAIAPGHPTGATQANVELDKVAGPPVASFTPKHPMRLCVEHTDTFGGEANYAWVKRYEGQICSGMPDREVVRKAKALCGFTNHPCRTESVGDGFAIYPRGVCQVIFVTFEEGEVAP